MKLENLKDFEWYNEPENVIFKGEDMRIFAMPQTDFWQNAGHQIFLDNGHFFFKNTLEDFTLEICFRFENTDKFSQCGLMARVDSKNWFKISIINENGAQPEIGHCLTVGGNSDWAHLPLSRQVFQIFYKLVRCGSDYVASYSLDGNRFSSVRQFVLTGSPLKAGAYVASPQKNDFDATLSEIVFY